MSVGVFFPVSLKKPDEQDAAGMWSLVKNIPNLDLNSLYSYLMLCSHFRDTCVVAKMDDEVVGFVTAFVSPEDPSTLFIWQLAVHPKSRKTGLATQMVQELLQRPDTESVRYVEATVTPSNNPSSGFFKNIADLYQSPCDVREKFPPHLFGDTHHERELLYRIGPVPSLAQR